MEKEIDEKKQGTSLVLEHKEENTKKLFIESYGCAMNFSDSEIVASILTEQGYTISSSDTNSIGDYGNAIAVTLIFENTKN